MPQIDSPCCNGMRCHRIKLQRCEWIAIMAVAVRGALLFMSILPSRQVHP
eukprot:m.448263 g.448263  ORF g.448263 m.448263 type:complete len:50 (-) comp19635_c0_seq1:565-714(-)